MLHGCGSKPMVPFSGRCITHSSLFEWGLGCSLGVRDLTHGHMGMSHAALPQIFVLRGDEDRQGLHLPIFHYRHQGWASSKS